MVPARPHDDPDDPGERGLSRRSLLTAGATLGTIGCSGCIRQFQSTLGLQSPDTISLRIKTVPTDADERAIRIARFLSTRLTDAGIDAQVVPMSEEELLRDVLLNQNFDLYVTRFPAQQDPDFLRPLLHSQYNAEPGWQNPFGYASFDVDDLLERQRTQRGRARLDTLRQIQQRLIRDCPFTVVAFQDELRLTRSDRFDGWDSPSVHSLEGYLSLSATREPTAPPAPTATTTTNRTSTATETATPTADDQLRMATTDARPTENLNPLAVEFAADDTITDLLYDSLGRYVQGRVQPWLATDWSWTDAANGAVATVQLREGLSWHDGNSLTADDVAFTYRFLLDTSLGSLENPVPAPKYRGCSSLVTGVAALDDHTVRLQFRPGSRPVIRRALTAPILPEHVWSQRAHEVTVTGRDLNGTVTQALVWLGTDPVGSGPFRVDSARTTQFLQLTPFEDHFLQDGEYDGPLSPYAGALPYDQLRFVVVPSSDVATEFVASGRVDATATSITVGDQPQQGLPDRVRRHVERPSAFYHVGFNVRGGPLGNPRFRHVVARLLDREFLVEEAFEGNATPATSPLARFDALAPGLAWGQGESELPFPGSNGQLDDRRARELFRQAGYRYGDDGRLLSG